MKERPIITPPRPDSRLLMHSCCAPCAVDIISEVHRAGIDFTILFYNPNIHPKREYELRKDENKRFADGLGIPFVDLDYDADQWFKRIKGLEMEPERGRRCTVCFDMRFERSALWATENGFNVFVSTLGISRWKDMDQINEAGVRAASRYDDLTYWTHNWRKNGGSARMIELSKQEQFYQQEYCGCVYSLRDTNGWRQSQGREKIRIGEKFYGFEAADEDAGPER